MIKKVNVLLSIAVLSVFLTATAFAHTPMLYVEDYGDGTIYLEGGYSDGSSASGVEILLVEDKTFADDTKARDDYLELIFGNENFIGLRDAYLKDIAEKGNESEISELIKIEGDEIIFNEEGEEVDFSKLQPEMYQEKQLIIFRSALDEYSSLNLPKPDGTYLVILNGGPGHIVEKEGPVLTDEEKKFLSE
jgi:hypothetical protein